MKKYTTSQRLKQLMAKRGLKQIDILNLAIPFCQEYSVKLGRNDLSQYVNGKVEPGQFVIVRLDEYAELVVDFLERLSPSTVVERVAGEVGSDYLVAPSWTAIKHAGRNAVERALRARDSYQGKYFDPSVQDPFVE